MLSHYCRQYPKTRVRHATVAPVLPRLLILNDVKEPEQEATSRRGLSGYPLRPVADVRSHCHQCQAEFAGDSLVGKPFGYESSDFGLTLREFHGSTPADAPAGN